MIKPTKRKAFNFLRSYFDVLNELKTDSDRLSFLLSIINKQFLNEDPKDLGFISNLCYESQRHQIESSVKGWERASNDTLSTTPPTPKQEEEEKGEEEVEEKEEYTLHTQESFLEWFKESRKHLGLEYNAKNLSIIERQLFKELKDYTKEDFNTSFTNFSKDKYYVSNNLLFPSYFLKPETFIKYLNQPLTKELTLQEKIRGVVR